MPLRCIQQSIAQLSQFIEGVRIGMIHLLFNLNKQADTSSFPLWYRNCEYDTFQVSEIFQRCWGIWNYEDCFNGKEWRIESALEIIFNEIYITFFYILLEKNGIVNEMANSILKRTVSYTKGKYYFNTFWVFLSWFISQ